MASSHPAAVYSRRRKAERRAGTWQGSTPVEVVAAHIDHLIDSGMTMTAIARQAGVGCNTVWYVRRRELPTVRGGTAKALLAVQPRPAPRANCRHSIGSTRRGQALFAIGYPLDALAREIGQPNGKHIGTVVRGERAWITDWLADQIADAYKRLADTPAPPSRYASAARNLASRKGWVGPDAWTDETIDDPAAEPYSWREQYADEVDDLAVAEVAAGRMQWSRLTREMDRLEVVRVLLAQGLGAYAIAYRVGTSKNVILRLAGMLAADTEAAA
jgi:hypothetical protein